MEDNVYKFNWVKKGLERIFGMHSYVCSDVALCDS